MNRRNFLQLAPAAAAAAQSSPLRLGVIGTGGRGTHLLHLLAAMPGVETPALCDINPQNLAKASDAVMSAGRPKPETYSGDEQAFRKLLAREDLHAVVIATPWNWHAEMTVAAMRAGKYAACEVPIAQTIEECWELVDTHEKTGVPCMMLENWSFRRDNLAVLNMIRRGMFGEIVHCHCAHSHDCLPQWFFDRQGNMRWGGEYLLKRNADQYPTHSLGPVLSWMNVNCGDAFDFMTSMASSSLGVNAYFRRTFGPDHPHAKREYAQGDIVTSMVRTKLGKTVVINYDMQLPRPYDNRWMIQGTEGVYSEDRDALYLLKHSPKDHQWEPFPPYQEKHEHRWWREQLQQRSNEKLAAGHGGTDTIELSQFLDAVRNRTETPIDVYDSVTMSAVTPLSAMSISKGSAPVPFPDFTRGRWRSRTPAFAV